MACTTNYKLGMNAKLYYGDCEDVLADLLEAANVKEVSLSLSANEVDITTRDNDGWVATAKSTRVLELTFKVQLNAGANVVADAMRDNFLGDDLMEFCALTGDKDTNDSEGPKFTGSVFSLTRNEGSEEAITYDITVKPSGTVTWVEVVAS